MFEIMVKHSFTASHALTNYMGGSEKKHSHDWICQAFVRAPELDKSGCAVDFTLIDSMLREATSEICDADINEHPFFKEVSPSAENVALFIFKKLTAGLQNPDAKIIRVTVSEDQDHAASFIRE